MVSDELMQRAKHYLAARKTQELDHTDPILDDARTETHDALMMQMDIEEVEYTDREHAAQIAYAIVAGESITLSRLIPQNRPLPAAVQGRLFDV